MSLIEHDDKVDVKLPQNFKVSERRKALEDYDKFLNALNYKNAFWAFGATLFAAIFFTVIPFTPIGKMLTERISLPIEFRARTVLKQNPYIAQNLKIILLEDNSLSYIKKPNLSLSEWADIIQHIDARNPERIYIDKIFGAIDTENKDLDPTIERLKQVKTPIATGAFVAPYPIRGRQRLKLFTPDYQIQEYTDDTVENAEKNLLNYSHSSVYGASPKLQEIFQAGHIIHLDERAFSPIISMGGGTVLPHITTYADKSFKIHEDRISYADKNRVEIHSKGLVNINYLPSIDFYKIAKPLKMIMVYAKRNRQLNYIQEGDHVLIIPKSYTGNTDFKDTPYGRMNGGLILACVLNSVLTGQWLHDVPHSTALIFLFCLLGGLIGLLKGSTPWLSLTITSVALVAIGLVLFSFYSLRTPWLISSTGLLFSGIFVLGGKSRIEKQKNDIFKDIQLENMKLDKENQMAIARESILLEEKKEAATIASAFRPEAFPRWDDVEITGYHKCFDAASGDWFFFEKADDNSLYHVIMCDITGHGVQAALVVSTCKTVHSIMLEKDPKIANEIEFPIRYMKLLNRTLYKQGNGLHVTTFSALTFEPAKEKLHYLTCAHPPPLFHAEGNIKKRPKSLRSRFNPLGIEAEAHAEFKTIDFKPGDEVVLHTDGIPITENIRAYSEFNKARPSWDEIPLKLYNFIWEYVKNKTGRDPDDDVSLVLCRLRQKEANLEKKSRKKEEEVLNRA